MRFRLGLLIGLAVGYVLGAKAGKERYDQIVNTFKRLTDVDSVQKATDKVKKTVGEGMTNASEAIRNTVKT
ncbi:MAG: hypothetical protein WAM81_07945 [Acidimicrobiia bacterium]